VDKKYHPDGESSKSGSFTLIRDMSKRSAICNSGREVIMVRKEGIEMREEHNLNAERCNPVGTIFLHDLRN
jgi:hypothetical protein